jgi:hypothetical protein
MDRQFIVDPSVLKQFSEYFPAKYRAGESANRASHCSADDESRYRGSLLLC